MDFLNYEKNFIILILLIKYVGQIFYGGDDET